LVRARRTIRALTNIRSMMRGLLVDREPPLPHYRVLEQ
jgi:hypothetical protein